MQKLVFLLLAVSILLLTGCATIMHGPNQTVSVASKPPNAEITIKTSSGELFAGGKTPKDFVLERKNSYSVTVSMPGYVDRQVMINKSFDSMSLANFIIGGGIIGMLIDAMNGSMWELLPNQIYVSLDESKEQKKEP